MSEEYALVKLCLNCFNASTMEENKCVHCGQFLMKEKRVTPYEIKSPVGIK